MKLIIAFIFLLLATSVQALGEESECDFSVNIITNKSIFFDDFEFKVFVNKTYGNKTNMILTREIKDPFGNKIKEYKNLSFEVLNHRTTKNSPNLMKNRAYILESRIFPACNDTKKHNNAATKEFFIIGKIPGEDSSIEIKNILDLGRDKGAEFGSIIRARIFAYKGNTNKKTIKAWIEKDNEKITKQTRINIEEKYSTQEVTFPLQIFPNCNGKLENGTYSLKISGLDSEDEKQLEVNSIKRNLCEEVEIVKNNTIYVNRTKKVYINITNSTETNLKGSVLNQSRIIYESSKKRSERYALFFFCGILILLIIKIKTENG